MKSETKNILIGAAATILPGGWIALGIYFAYKAIKNKGKKDAQVQKVSESERQEA